MAEQINLAAPAGPPPATNYRIVRREEDWGVVPSATDENVELDQRHAHVTVWLLGDNGQRLRLTVARGAEARQLIRQANSANFTNISQNKRLMNLIIQKGLLAGAVADVPDEPIVEDDEPVGPTPTPAPTP